ncbi:MAG: sporulation inhibitor of replication protein SirA [Bacilli bacterium]|nr:sporulation inhibitor of replication protein SirA [Bacilli bacterium]
MRIYYVFDIRSEYVDLYKETPNSLYNVLHQLYYMRKKDLEYGFNMFKQLANRIDKEELDKNIFLKLHNKMTYVKKGDNHIINNLYKDEVSALKVKYSYILINTNKSYTDFFNTLALDNRNYFVCDFINNDYFFLSNIKILV